MGESFTFERKDNYLIIDIKKEKLDFFRISETSKEIKEAISENNHPNIIFNLNKVVFMDSSVFGFIIETRKKVIENGNEVVIVCDNNKLLKILEILKVSQLIEIFSSIEDAAMQMKKKL